MQRTDRSRITRHAHVRSPLSPAPLFGALLAGAAFLFPATSLSAHGGIYRGPGDTVPPGAGGGAGAGGPTTGGGGPGTPGAGGPTTGTPTGPTGPGSGGPGGAGPVTGGERDTADWTFWWEFNKDPFLNLKAALAESGPRTGEEGFFLGRGSEKQARDLTRPDDALVFGEIVPALRAALAASDNRDVVTGCLVALAKIGDEPGAAEPVANLIAQYLEDSTQEVRETAALALGILASGDSVPLLRELVADSPAGRKAVGSTEVDRRTRSFAAFGLGLVGHRTEDEGLRRELVQFMVEALPAAEREAAPDVAVALISSIGRTPLRPVERSAPSADEPTAEQLPWGSRQAQIEFLVERFEDPRGERLRRAHLPIAAARLLEGLGERAEPELKQRIARGLLATLDPRKNGAYPVELRMSAAQALGRIADADDDPLDAEIRAALAGCRDAERQVERFATIALAKAAARPGSSDAPIAGRAAAVAELGRRLSRGKSGADRWAAIGLGVHAHIAAEADPDARLSDDVRQLLLKETVDAKAKADIGAFAIACGLVGDPDSLEPLLERLKEESDPEARGYTALGLGLLGDRRAILPLQAILGESEYRPALLRQTATALGLLGDAKVAGQLVGMLSESRTLSTQAAVASALGFIGDRTAVEPLIRMLEDDTVTAAARGFAAAALGLIADKETLPWGSKFAVDVNYRASTETLNSTAGNGLLNIL